MNGDGISCTRTREDLSLINQSAAEEALGALFSIFSRTTQSLRVSAHFLDVSVTEGEAGIRLFSSLKQKHRSCKSSRIRWMSANDIPRLALCFRDHG